MEITMSIHDLSARAPSIGDYRHTSFNRWTPPSAANFTEVGEDRALPAGRARHRDKAMPASSIQPVLKVRDVMSTDVISVNPDTSVQDVADMMTRHRVGAVAVLDSRKRLRGLISEADLIQRIEIATEPRCSFWKAIFRDAITAADDYVRAHGRKARDVMTSDPISTTLNEPMHKVAALMARKRLAHIPVIYGDELIGMLARSDIVRVLATRRFDPGDVTAASDVEISAHVNDRIRSLPWSLRMHIANVIVRNGIARIYGWVSSNVERRALHVVAENTPGVREVIDHMHRTPPYV
jgi:CBS domain-containing protein